MLGGGGGAGYAPSDDFLRFCVSKPLPGWGLQTTRLGDFMASQSHCCKTCWASIQGGQKPWMPSAGDFGQGLGALMMMLPPENQSAMPALLQKRKFVSPVSEQHDSCLCH